LNNIFKQIRKDKVVYIDVNARWGIPEQWGCFGDIVTVIGFEPDKIECEKLNTQAQENNLSIRFLPIALSCKKEKLTLNITKIPGCSSILKPNRKILNLFPVAERYDIVRSTQLGTLSLDSIQPGPGEANE
jgi:hypothetical protein